MLVLTQLSVGAFVVGLVLKLSIAGDQLRALVPVAGVNALVFGLLALGASVFHLGRPRLRLSSSAWACGIRG